MPHPARRRNPSLAHALALAIALPGLAATVRAEPADLPDLTCTAVRQELDGGLRLQIRFENRSAAAIELPPGPQLVLYADRDATDALEPTARMDRVQRTPIAVAPETPRTEWFAVSVAATEALRCARGTPAAAAIYFYRFSPRPQSRCRLQGLELEPLRAGAACTEGARR